MKWNERWTEVAASVCLGLLSAALTGCGSNSSSNPADAAKAEEIERLRQENQELADAQSANEEVRRLRKENEDLPRLRSQYQEAGRLRKENDQLRQQITKISPSAATQNVVSVTGTVDPARALANAQALLDTNKAKILAEQEVVNEDDDIMLEPKYLSQIIPNFDWQKIDRKDPVGIKALLEQNGVQITNVSQLHEMGLTNFTVRKAVVPAKPDSQPASEAK